MTSQWDTWRFGSGVGRPPGVDPVDRCRVRGIEGGSASGARHGARRSPSADTNVGCGQYQGMVSLRRRGIP